MPILSHPNQTVPVPPYFYRIFSNPNRFHKMLPIFQNRLFQALLSLISVSYLINGSIAINQALSLLIILSILLLFCCCNKEGFKFIKIFTTNMPLAPTYFWLNN